ncbi:hypothetical protein HanXRQr2_Chr05g0236231 [Helianthus annuus]|uniref:BYPASS-related protein n=1 Tax=Helianthus annuus TaxID=4232 RepID=A0A251UUG3_HELAN|nr:uncharacterized protein LOC110944178 [Helianthus annuus]KAF5807668.1 hypothetical protein HanXRQr2_Chr05g0236231 [Helianthus annuus]KAJ0571763.1 hypothetical protein HanHA300_Chr05g0193721 [Helianthus annuus]KAJ0578983.1 hypothetical protein HanIR_Chr05g0253891 [Helianthus annuus]KAJ0586138.1 hypothetical protein HanHA89_Chr05g0208531 [Helianthus annuus]KAJ0924411.1 hypothetical protein HanPSC8_Chr05g0227871 [Helianthus annuus]
MLTHYRGSSSPSITRLRRSILGLKRYSAVHSIDSHTHELTTQEHEVEAFLKMVTQKFYKLSLVESHELLSGSWISKLLDVFLCCQEQFRVLLSNNRSCLSKQPMAKLVSDYFERSVKGLDICNVVRDGIEQMRQWEKQLEIVLNVLGDQTILGDSQFQRAKRALNNLEIKIFDEKESRSIFSHKSRSFDPKDLKNQESNGTKMSRSLSASVSRSWSASKQLLAIGNNIVVPKSNDVLATNGLVLTIYTMTHVLYFVMWVLVASSTSQDRGLQLQFNNYHKNFTWWVPMSSLQERILEEYKKRGRRHSCGILKEVHRIETYVCFMKRFIDSVQFPLRKEQEEEAKKMFEELKNIYDTLKNALDPSERQVKDIFQQIIRCRIEGLDYVARQHD